MNARQRMHRIAGRLIVSSITLLVVVVPLVPVRELPAQMRTVALWIIGGAVVALIAGCCMSHETSARRYWRGKGEK